METHSNSWDDPRSTRDVNDRERRIIRDSQLQYKDLAKIFHITEDQVRYIRSAEGRRAGQLTKVWNEEEENMLFNLYEEHGWKPAKVSESFPQKTYTQVYRKMLREFKGR